MMKLLSRYLGSISGGVYRLSRDFSLELLEQNEKARVLDIGCGDGEFTRQVANKTGSDKIYGVEISPQYAERARQNGINVVMADIDFGLPFEDTSFDIVVSNQVIEHVNSTDNFIRECHRILRKEGICICSTPNLASFHNTFSLILGYQPFAAAVSDELICGNPLDPCDGQQIPSYRRHRRIFTAPALRRLFEFHGFKVEALKGVGLHPLPLSLSRHIKWTRYSLLLTIKARKLEA
jgi:methionine biosynthesis protein MetW